MGTVHVVLPEGVDDVTRRSGGNVYDRRVCDGLRDLGWDVREHEVRGAWPSPSGPVREAVGRVLSGLDDGSLVVLDGLVASAATDLLHDEASRLRLLVLVHLPMALGSMTLGAPSAEVAAQERRVLRSVAAVVTTSGWTRRWLVDRYGLDERRVHVAEPGVDESGLAPGSSAGGELLCVAAVAPHKGQDLLLAALRRVNDVPWRCLCVGSTTRDPEFAADIAHAAEAAGLADRFLLAGNRWGPELDASYAAADVLVLPSRAETYGLVVTEALARGLPVIAADVGGVAEALGDGGGSRPGLLVTPDDADALAEALRSWLLDPDLRSDLRRAAAARRLTLRRWTAPAAALSRVLESVAYAAGGEPVTGSGRAGG